MRRGWSRWASHKHFHGLEHPPDTSLMMPHPNSSHLVLEEAVNHVCWGQGHLLK